MTLLVVQLSVESLYNLYPEIVHDFFFHKLGIELAPQQLDHSWYSFKELSKNAATVLHPDLKQVHGTLLEASRLQPFFTFRALSFTILILESTLIDLHLGTQVLK